MKYVLISAAIGVLAACQYPLEEAANSPADAIVVDYASAFATDVGRPDGDYADYVTRKSLEVLTFTGVKPGMTVVEMEAGDGFYTELLASVVGDEGKVFQQNPAQFDNFLGTSVEDRGHLTRYSNIEYIKVPFDALTVADGEADMVTWFLGPHELWFVPRDEVFGVFGGVGVDSTFAEIARTLKPGGTFVALDHSAPEGAPPTTGDDTHRIDKAIIISKAEAAGLTLVEEATFWLIRTMI